MYDFKNCDFRQWIRREYARNNAGVCHFVNHYHPLLRKTILQYLWDWYIEDLAAQSDYSLPDDKITAKFWQFHHANPWIYQIFETWALEDFNNGQEHGAIEQLYNNLRWGRPHPFSIHKVTEAAEMPNEFKSRYSRLIMQNNPELHGYFRIKKLR